MDKKFNEWFHSTSKQGLSFTEMIYRAYIFGKESKRRPRKPKEESELYKPLVEIWLKEVHPGWTFSSVDGAAIKSIETKMRAWIANPNNHIPVVIDKNYFENFFRHFCKKLPDFYKNQTLNVLASKFDSIIEEIKTQNGKKRIVHRAAEGLSDFAR